MDPELKAYLGGMMAEMVDMKTGLRAEMAGMKMELKEHTEVMETRLLNAFWKWAKTSDAKGRQQGVTVMAFDEGFPWLRIA